MKQESHSVPQVRGRASKPQLPQDIQTVVTANATDLIDLWQGVDIAYLFDAVKKQAAPDALYRLDAHLQRLPADPTNHSTHGFSVADMVELARTLNQLPPQLIVYGIRGHQFGTRHGLSPEVKQTVDHLVQQVRLELSKRLTKFQYGTAYDIFLESHA